MEIFISIGTWSEANVTLMKKGAQNDIEPLARGSVDEVGAFNSTNGK